MTTDLLLQQLHQRDIHLAPDGNELRVVSQGELPAELREQIRAHKPELLRRLAASNGVSPSATPVFIDLETRSRADIKRGGRHYATDNSTELLSVVALIDRTLLVWSPLWPAGPAPELVPPEAAAGLGFEHLDLVSVAGPALPELLHQAILSGRAFCAHNGVDFDRYVWAAAGLPAPAAWIDTLPLARAAGLPGGLDQIGRRLFERGKDPVGKRLIQRLCKPQSDGRFVEPSPDELVQLLRYNVVDVLLLARVYAQVANFAETDVLVADRRINDRGVHFDVELAQSLLRLDEQALYALQAEAHQLSGGQIQASDLNRRDFLLNWLWDRGLDLPDLRRETLDRFLRSAPESGAVVDPAVLAVIRARLSTSRNASSKLSRAIELLHEDGRLRDLLVYHKGHTGRWAGRGVQPQNLPKPHKRLSDIPALIEQVDDLERFRSALPEGVGIEDGLASLIRPCFRPQPGHLFCIADFASIEARGVAWCADDRGLLASFERGEDVYCGLASQLFGYAVTREHRHERDIGKIAVLGCGYQMSAMRFGEYAEALGVDLSLAGVTAETVVDGYRNAYPDIAGYWVSRYGREWREGGLWRNVEQAAREAIGDGRASEAGRCRFEIAADCLYVTLPSGRRIVYRNALLRDPDPDGPAWAKPEIVFDMPERLSEGTYGGKLVENIVQAICRDLLAVALVHCEKSGLPVVLHVHDEIIAEVPEQYADETLEWLLAVMSTRPAWAAGFPIEVDGFVAPRLLKSPPPGQSARRARNGVLLTES